MQIIESFSINGKNTTKKLFRNVPGLLFKFDTGHRCVKFNDGVELFISKPRKNGGDRLLNERTDVKLIEEMRRLVALGLN